jgi:hypothetical protein
VGMTPAERRLALANMGTARTRLAFEDEREARNLRGRARAFQLWGQHNRQRLLLNPDLRKRQLLVEQALLREALSYQAKADAILRPAGAR